jgi:hypothetical protein
MFRLIDPSSGQNHGTFNAYALTEYSSTMVLAWWWLSEPKHVAEFSIFNIDYNICCVIDEINLLYYRKTQRDGSYQRQSTLICLSSLQFQTAKNRQCRKINHSFKKMNWKTIINMFSVKHNNILFDWKQIYLLISFNSTKQRDILYIKKDKFWSLSFWVASLNILQNVEIRGLYISEATRIWFRE